MIAAGQCGIELIDAFVADHTQPPDVACLQEVANNASPDEAQAILSGTTPNQQDTQ